MPQPGGGCLPCQYRPKNPRAGCVSVEQTRQAVFTHAVRVLDGSRHETVRILPWQPAGVVLASRCLQHLRPWWEVGRFLLQVFTNLCCFFLKAPIRMVWWPSEKSPDTVFGICATAGWQGMPSFIHVLHILHVEVKVLPFVFKVQVHLGALTRGNGADELFTVGEFTLVWFFSHKAFPEMKRWDPSMTHNTHNAQICLTNHLNHIVLFQLKEKSQALPPAYFPSSVDLCSLKTVVQAHIELVYPEIHI